MRSPTWSGQILEEKFGDKLVFDPIEVIPKIDLDGDEYLHIYMVYDGDAKLLDPSWDIGILSTDTVEAHGAWSRVCPEQVLRGKVRLGRGLRKQAVVNPDDLVRIAEHLASGRGSEGGSGGLSRQSCAAP